VCGEKCVGVYGMEPRLHATDNVPETDVRAWHILSPRDIDLEGGILHRSSTILDHDSLAAELLQVWKSL
jgi:hypothetical protein